MFHYFSSSIFIFFHVLFHFFVLFLLFARCIIWRCFVVFRPKLVNTAYSLFHTASEQASKQTNKKRGLDACMLELLCFFLFFSSRLLIHLLRTDICLS